MSSRHDDYLLAGLEGTRLSALPSILGVPLCLSSSFLGVSGGLARRGFVGVGVGADLAGVGVAFAVGGLAPAAADVGVAFPVPGLAAVPGLLPVPVPALVPTPEAAEGVPTLPPIPPVVDRFAAVVVVALVGAVLRLLSPPVLILELRPPVPATEGPCPTPTPAAARLL